MAARGADLMVELCGERPRLLTHCNTGALAAVTGGTALGVVGELHRRGALAGVIASETRPLLQGARLTAWELAELGVAFRVAVDSAGPFLMARGDVDAVIVGRGPDLRERRCGQQDRNVRARARRPPGRPAVRGRGAGVHGGRRHTGRRRGHHRGPWRR
jgi:hypothetical protein